MGSRQENPDLHNILRLAILEQNSKKLVGTLLGW